MNIYFNKYPYVTALIYLVTQADLVHIAQFKSRFDMSIFTHLQSLGYCEIVATPDGDQICITDSGHCFLHAFNCILR